MNREVIHRRFEAIQQGFVMTDKAINATRADFQSLQKGVDRIYLRSLTHEMMWDVLMGLLIEKGLFTKEQFDQALKDLGEKTKAAMEAAEKKKKEAEELAAGKVTVLSDVPAIPVVK